MPSLPAGEGAGLQKTPLLTESHNIPYIVLPALNGKVNMVHPLVEYQLGAFQGPESAEHQFGAADVVLGPAIIMVGTVMRPSTWASSSSV